jgi:hypothetical protein
MGEQREPMSAVRFSEALNQEVADLTRSFTQHTRGGFDLKEVIRFVFECTDSMSDLGMQFTELSHQTQKDEVCNAIRLLYKDRNPDLPWVQEPFETLLETAIFDFVIPELFTVMVKSKMKAPRQREQQQGGEESQSNQQQGGSEESQRMQSQESSSEESQFMSNDDEGGGDEYASQSGQDDNGETLETEPRGHA